MRYNKKDIKQSAQELLEEMPQDITVLAIADGCSQKEIEAALEAGITHLGHSQIGEVEPMIHALGKRAIWHMTGHMKSGQVKKTVQLFEMVDRLDSWNLAKRLDRRGRSKGKIISVLIEIKDGYRDSKTGISFDSLEDFILRMAVLQFVRVDGLMTPGLEESDSEKNRRLYRAMRKAYESIIEMNRNHATMRYLSMGTSRDYHIALDEGANMIRIGSKIFGPRHSE